MVDRWTKLSDSQLKIGLASSGISFQSTLANNIIGNKDDDIIGRGDSMLGARFGGGGACAQGAR